jgi:hypothetical protein
MKLKFLLLYQSPTSLGCPIRLPEDNQIPSDSLISVWEDSKPVFMIQASLRGSAIKDCSDLLAKLKSCSRDEDWLDDRVSFDDVENEFEVRIKQAGVAPRPRYQKPLGDLTNMTNP